MSLNNNKLAEINRLMKHQAEIEQRMIKITMPLLSDFTQIKNIYNICVNTLAYLKDKNQTRKVFIFITLYMYCPQRFFGGKMPHGMRDSIAQALGEGTPTRISTEVQTLIDMYIRGKFNKYVNEAYAAVERELGL